MEFVFAYLAGLMTLINPCVLPVLPIVLVSALNVSRMGPVALAAGMGVSFVVFGMVVATFGRSIGLTEDTLAEIGAIIMVLFGIVLLVPMFARRFEMATAGFAAKADTSMDDMASDTLRGQFIGGLLLGAAWSPCIGPTIGGAIGMASRGESLIIAALIMVLFALGVATIIIGLGMGAREAIRRRTNALRGLAERAKPILGATFVLIGVALYFGVHKMAEAWMLDQMPIWLQDFLVVI